MGQFLVVTARPQSPEAVEQARALEALAHDQGLSLARLEDTGWIATLGPRHPRRLQVGPWTLIGEVFDRRSPDYEGIGPHDPLAYEKKMMARLWGRYVGIRRDRDGTPSAVLRDPSGALECVVWRAGALTILGSFAPAWLVAYLKPDWRIDRDRLADALSNPLAGTGALILDGPLALEPGTHQVLPPDAPADVLWRPSDYARDSLGPRPSLETAAARLRDAVDETVAGLASLCEPLACEVSGGLDSSIVASSLSRLGPGRVGLWLNAVGAVPEADERRWADALADHLGIAVSNVPHAKAPLTAETLEAIGQGLRPGLNGLDPTHDQDWADRLTHLGLGAVMTGKGGDALFQQAIPEVFTDRWRARGWRSLLEPDTVALAAANERSVWAMARQAQAFGKNDAPAPARRSLALPPTHSPPPHPWLKDLDAFGPAKRLQIAGVADGVSRHGPSLLTAAVEVLHPFCSQPVVEACLRLDAGLLVLGGRDRGLARHAFAGRLPSVIVARRSKGDMSRIYGRAVADALPVLRPWILDGRLVEMGLVDRAAAERLLTRDSLIWRGRASTLLATAAVEAWVRVWEGRLGRRA